MKKELICLDLDNTLIKSNRCHLDAYQLAFRKNKVQQRIPNDRILRYFGEGGMRIVQRLFPGAPRSFINQVVKDHDYFVRKKTSHKVKIIPGAREVVKKLQEQWKLALISNCNRNTIKILLKAAHLPQAWFSIIIGQDQVKHPKPAPDEVLKAEHMLHMKAKYFIGDSIYDVRAGRRAGVRVIAIPSGVHSARQLQKETPFKICKKIIEVVRVIQ